MAVVAAAAFAAMPLSALSKGHRMTAADLLTAARSHRAQIASLAVVHVDDLTQTQIPIQPRDLAGWPSAFHHHVKDAHTIDEAFGLVEASRPVADAHPLEMRWKLTFADAHGKPVLEVYQQSFEAYGMIDTVPVRFENDSLLKFLHAHFAAHEQTLDKL